MFIKESFKIMLFKVREIFRNLMATHTLDSLKMVNLVVKDAINGKIQN
jgi:hypothetical protein